MGRAPPILWVMDDDEPVPPVTLFPGVRLALVYHDGRESKVADLAVVTARGRAIVARPGEPLDLAPGTAATVVQTAARLVAPAEFVRRSGSLAVLHLRGEWRPLGVRRSQRFSTSLHATLAARGESFGQYALVDDLSLGGAHVLARHYPSKDDVTLHVTAEGGSAWLNARVVGREETGDYGVGLHLQFTDLMPAHERFVARLVGTLEAAARLAG